MNQTSAPTWESKKTAETQDVEKLLREQGHFHQVDAYRYNEASIRVRVIDPRFRGKSVDQRDRMVDKFLRKLPESTQQDIVNLLTFTPEEVAAEGGSPVRAFSLNLEFENPTS